MRTLTEDLREIDWGKTLLRVLELLIVMPFTLPLKIYMNAIMNLSHAKEEQGEVNQLSKEFPLYVWLISVFDAILFLSYPIGTVLAIRGWASYFGGFGLFAAILGLTYFFPLYITLIKEFAQISLKLLLYLKIIASKE
ncbi:hypothetical protein [Maribacter sp. 2307UL18-2]|uniref:hypothetical protein n=1 Tax=Maribacter sp. 2307UL18-2 TaxID=3386274 RepID=UPI0039BC9F3F